MSARLKLSCDFRLLYVALSMDTKHPILLIFCVVSPMMSSLNGQRYSLLYLVIYMYNEKYFSDDHFSYIIVRVIIIIIIIDLINTPP